MGQVNFKCFTQILSFQFTNFTKYQGPSNFTKLNQIFSKYSIIRSKYFDQIGYWHEHQRRDRDQWVKVHWENIVSHNSPSRFASLKLGDSVIFSTGLPQFIGVKF